MVIVFHVCDEGAREGRVCVCVCLGGGGGGGGGGRGIKYSC